MTKNSVSKHATKFRIEAMPTLVFFKDGKELSRSVGYLKEDQLRKN